MPSSSSTTLAFLESLARTASISGDGEGNPQSSGGRYSLASAQPKKIQYAILCELQDAASEILQCFCKKNNRKL